MVDKILENNIFAGVCHSLQCGQIPLKETSSLKRIFICSKFSAFTWKQLFLGKVTENLDKCPDLN